MGNGISRMNQPDCPTPWQRKTIWRALTALAIAAIFAVAVGFIYIFSQVMAFLQPILVPFAIAGVLAYLLDPLVQRLERLGTTRARAVTAVFAIATLTFVGMLIWIIPIVATQTDKLAGNLPEITYRVRLGVANFAKKIHDAYGMKILPDEYLVVPKPRSRATPTPETPKKATPTPAPVAPEQGTRPAAEPAPVTPPPDPAGTKPLPSEARAPVLMRSPESPAPAAETEGKASAGVSTTTAAMPVAAAPPTAAGAATTPAEDPIQKLASGDWIQDAMPTVWKFISASLGGFLGFFGFLLSLVIVPLYLFYFLAESNHIAKSWSKYLPLKASAFKDEVVGSLTEINGYLIAFFRGQLVVSIINGTATGLLLAAVGLDFGILIGFALCFLGIIPYIGIILCWLPAVIIASVQGGSWVVAADAARWVFPAIVTGIFVVVQQVDGLFVTPKIVGDRVGLHPVTVIFSVFLWSLLLGGLLGAILAVPLTATAKVILRRYVWERTIMAEVGPERPILSDK